jgi:hypothetical protein
VHQHEPLCGFATCVGYPIHPPAQLVIQAFDTPEAPGHAEAGTNVPVGTPLLALGLGQIELADAEHETIVLA